MWCFTAGTSTLIESHPELLQNAVYDDESEAVYRKDVGQGKKLRKWSRGHQFVVCGGGHNIDTWQPLYRYIHSGAPLKRGHHWEQRIFSLIATCP